MDDRKGLSFGEFLQDIRGVVTSPVRRFPIIRERGALWGSLFLVLFPSYLGFSFLGGFYFDKEPFPGCSWLLPGVAVTLFTYVKFLSIHIVARLLEGKGRYTAGSGKFRDLCVVVGYSGIPSLIALIVAFGVFLSIPSQAGYLLRHFRPVAISLMVAFGIALFVWNLILMVLALRHVYPMRDLKLVIAVILGQIIFAGPAMSLNLLVGPVEVEAGYAVPILHENMMRFFTADPAAEESRPSNIDMHVDRLAYKFRDPRRFDFVFFTPVQESRDSSGHVVIGKTGVGAIREKDKALGRVVGLPGERVEVAAGQLRINGRPWAEPYLTSEWKSTASIQPQTLRPREYLVLPENRRLLETGAGVVPIERDRIAGRMMLTRWPLGWWLYRPAVFLKGNPE